MEDSQSMWTRESMYCDEIRILDWIQTFRTPLGDSLPCRRSFLPGRKKSGKKLFWIPADEKPALLHLQKMAL